MSRHPSTVPPLQSAVREAAARGNLTAVQVCLDKEPELAADPETMFNAVVSLSLDIIQLLCAHGANINQPYIKRNYREGFESQHYPLLDAAKLDFDEAVDFFLSLNNATTAVNVLVTTPIDELYKVGNMPLYFSSGRNLLHICAAEKSMAVLRLLFEKKPELLPGDIRAQLLAATDPDGCTPLDLALFRPPPSGGGDQCDAAAKILCEAAKSGSTVEATGEAAEAMTQQPVAKTQQQREEYLQKMRSRVKESVDRRRQQLISRYNGDPNAFLFQPGQYLAPQTAAAGGVASGNINNAHHHYNPPALHQMHPAFEQPFSHSHIVFLNPHWKSTIKEVCPNGVWTVKLFSDEAVQLIRDEVDAVCEFYDNKKNDSSNSNNTNNNEGDGNSDVSTPKLRRPNSMNNYGFVLRDVGLGPWLDGLVHVALEEVARTVPGSTTRGWNKINSNNNNSNEEEESHGGIDDEAQLMTFSFKSAHSFIIKYSLGEDLNLAQHVDDSDFTFNICLNRCDEPFEGATLYFHGESQTTAGTGPRYEYAHEPGVAVIHRGSVPHGVQNLTKGKRVNLVVWCKEMRNGYYHSGSG